MDNREWKAQRDAYNARLAEIEARDKAERDASCRTARAEREARGEPEPERGANGGRGSRWWLNQGRHSGRSYRA